MSSCVVFFAYLLGWCNWSRRLIDQDGEVSELCDLAESIVSECKQNRPVSILETAYLSLMNGRRPVLYESLPQSQSLQRAIDEIHPTLILMTYSLNTPYRNGFFFKLLKVQELYGL